MLNPFLLVLNLGVSFLIFGPGGLWTDRSLSPIGWLCNSFTNRLVGLLNRFIVLWNSCVFSQESFQPVRWFFNRFVVPDPLNRLVVLLWFFEPVGWSAQPTGWLLLQSVEGVYWSVFFESQETFEPVGRSFQPVERSRRLKFLIRNSVVLRTNWGHFSNCSRTV